MLILSASLTLNVTLSITLSVTLTLPLIPTLNLNTQPQAHPSPRHYSSHYRLSATLREKSE